MRVLGEVTDETHHELALRWFNGLTAAHAGSVAVDAGAGAAVKLAALRPLTQAKDLPKGVTRHRAQSATAARGTFPPAEGGRRRNDGGPG